jgi:hypothetical protein
MLSTAILGSLPFVPWVTGCGGRIMDLGASSSDVAGASGASSSGAAGASGASSSGAGAAGASAWSSGAGSSGASPAAGSGGTFGASSFGAGGTSSSGFFGTAVAFSTATSGTGPAIAFSTATSGTGPNVSSPSGPASAGRAIVITFNDAPIDLGSSYTESGFTVSPLSGSWAGDSNYGNPAPFIEFNSPAGTAEKGLLQVTSGAGTFRFSSIDLYSSTTPIPYLFEGSLSGSLVYAEQGTVPNTFGQFQTVRSQHATVVIDTVNILLGNAPAACCPNPMGVDNIVLVR